MRNRSAKRAYLGGDDGVLVERRKEENLGREKKGREGKGRGRRRERQSEVNCCGSGNVGALFDLAAGGHSQGALTLFNSNATAEFDELYEQAKAWHVRSQALLGHKFRALRRRLLG